MYFEQFSYEGGIAALAARLQNRPHLAWLDGSIQYGPDGRFSYLSSDPEEVLQGDTSNPFAILSTIEETPGVAESDVSHLPPGLARLPRHVGFLSYDACLGRRSTHLPRDNDTVPLAYFGRYEAFFVEDHVEQQLWIAGKDKSSCAALLRRLETEPTPEEALASSDKAPFKVEKTTEKVHTRAIERALAYIRQGEVYEINLARRFRTSSRETPFALWTRMRKLSPVPFGFFLQGKDFAILGATMERFLLWEGPGKALLTEPIKGTSPQPTKEVEQKPLRADPKEHAEHVMVVDLMRNDLGRVAVPGTVEVGELMQERSFAGLSHMISQIRCKTPQNLTLSKLVGEVFPPGSVTGTPKKRAIEIIDELETSARGVYTGMLGYVDIQGGASFSVAIRTAVCHQGSFTYHAGGGIVADSNPAREVAETELKAQAFLRSITS